MLELNCQRILVNWFQKTATQGPVHFHIRAQYLVTLIFVKYVPLHIDHAQLLCLLT